MALVITKLDNNQVEVTGGSHPYTLLSSYEVYLAADIDGVQIVREGKMKDQFIQSDVTQVVRGDGTIVAISNKETLYSELKEFFFFEVGGTGGTVVKTSDVAIIGSGDWILGGEGAGSTHYFVFTHGLGTRDLLFEARDTDGDFVRQLNDYFTTGLAITDGLNQVRIETSDNSISVAVLISDGGSSVVTDTLTYDPSNEIIADASPTGKDGLNTPVNSATDKTLTIDTAICGIGKFATFTQLGVGRILYVSGTLNLLPYVNGSHISGGVNSVTMVYNIDGVNVRIMGEVQ